jgi:hypothetical protein
VALVLQLKRRVPEAKEFLAEFIPGLSDGIKIIGNGGNIATATSEKRQSRTSESEGRAAFRILGPRPG